MSGAASGMPRAGTSRWMSELVDLVDEWMG